MSIFNKKGMMIFPVPKKLREICEKEELLVFTECYCPNGHNLISENVQFNELKGILLKISDKENHGHVALNAVYGCKSRVALGIKLREGSIYRLSCPECDEILPVFTKCHCGGDIFALFLDKQARFDYFVGACARIGCTNAVIQLGKELINSARLESF